MIIRVARIAIIFLGLHSAILISQPLYPALSFSALKDSDHDGVIDARDICSNTPQGSDINNDGCPLTKLTLFSFNFDVKFQTGQYKLASEFHTKLKDLAAFLQHDPNTLLLIEGYTDNVGAESYNLTLSKKRAESIANALILTFSIAAVRIKTFGYGQNRPVASNSTETGREANRRVSGEIVIPLKSQYVNKSIHSNYSTNQPKIDQYNLTIPFKLNRYGIKNAYRPSIQHLGQLLQSDPDILIFIEGHTDNTGSKDYNVALSLERANNIADLLNAQFTIAPARLKVLGHGQQFPLKSNNTIKGRRENRRVEVKVVKKFKAKQEIILPKWTIWSIDQMENERQKGKQ
ncbi:OmpA family protein [Marinomonas primoryensis]|uniref:Outer membrane protein OmpA n=1 Tax=Marinomonas primoryensis TaxID=178399 RepID=A0A859CZV2_9GAMM|nr:OmpA family protein [Marinomonas primoryensis]QKK80040.1 outer membrane protein OmpA [Marinomonas primoryensis]